jgi:hypothetical protein
MDNVYGSKEGERDGKKTEEKSFRQILFYFIFFNLLCHVKKVVFFASCAEGIKKFFFAKIVAR